jgi:hypothetical protein
VPQHVLGGEAGDGLPLAPVDGLDRLAEAGGPPRLDFDEDEGVALASHDVDFSQPRPEAAGENLVPLTLQFEAGVILARLSEGNPIRRH